MDLLQPVELRDWSDYRRALEEEQGGSCAWLQRVARGEEPLRWTVPASLERKVHSMGDLRPFWGDTVVFPLEGEGLDACERLQEQLTQGLEDLFAARLDPREFHLTLHDLSNGAKLPRLEREQAENEEACRRIFREIRSTLERQPELGEIRMRPVRIFDCLNISVLVGFAPASDRDYRLLQNLYRAFDEVRKLDYWLRPHVTLAYFRPRVPTMSEVEELARRCATIGPVPELRLPVWDLAYQHFEDMNRYLTRFTVRTA